MTTDPWKGHVPGKLLDDGRAQWRICCACGACLPPGPWGRIRLIQPCRARVPEIQVSDDGGHVHVRASWCKADGTVLRMATGEGATLPDALRELAVSIEDLGAMLEEDER